MNQQWQCWLHLLPPLEAAGSVPGAGTSRRACHLPGPPSTGCAATDHITQERSRSSQSYDWAWKSQISLYCIGLVKRICRARKNWRKKGNRFYLLIESGRAYRKGWIWRGVVHGMWDLSSWQRMEPTPSALGAWSSNHWTTREVPGRERIDGGSPCKLSPTYVYNLLLKLGLLFAVSAAGGLSEFPKFINLLKEMRFSFTFCCWWLAFWISTLCLALF